MSKERASFTSDIVTILLGILPEHVSPAGGKTNWKRVATTLNSQTGKYYTSTSVKNWFTNMKERHRAWNELKKWTGIGWSKNGCLIVDVEGEKWKGFVKRYKSVATVFLKTPLQNEAEWDKILQSGYAKGDRSYTPASVAKQDKFESIRVEDSDDSEYTPLDGIHDIETHNNESKSSQSPTVSIDTKKRKSGDMHSMPSKKSTRDQDIDTCLDILRKSSMSQSSKSLNKFDEVYEILDSMGIALKYGDEFVVDILDSFRITAGAVDLFISLRNDKARRHFLKKHCVLLDDDKIV
ncbi:hypothetical protein OROMI_025171 [Orobanche minor]